MKIEEKYKLHKRSWVGSRMVGMIFVCFFCAVLFAQVIYPMIWSAGVDAMGTTDREIEVEKRDDALDMEMILRQQAESANLHIINDALVRHYDSETEQIVPAFRATDILDDAMTGNAMLDTGNIFQKAIRFLLREFLNNMRVVMQLIVIAVICAVLRNLQSAFAREGTGEIAYYAGYVLMATLLMAGFKMAADVGVKAIMDMSDFMHVSTPILITLMTASGNVSSGTVFSPILMGMVQGSVFLVRFFFVPALFFIMTMGLMGHISTKIDLTGIAAFAKKICAWTMTIFFTIFVGGVVIQAAFSAALDGLGGRTMRTATSSMVPVIGRYLAEAADLVMGCSLMIRNAAGTSVLIGILVIMLVPLLKILALIGGYRLAAAIVQVLGEKQLAGCIGEAAGTLTYLFALAAFVSLMFFITITVMISL